MNGELLACWVMVALAAASVALSFARGARPSALMVAADAVMLIAMVDVCLVGSQVVAPVMWAGALLALTLAASASARFARPLRSESMSTHDVGHPLAMIIGAGLLLFMGAGGHGSSGQGVAAHAHGSGAGAAAVVVILVLCAVAHLVVVAIRTPALAHAGARIEGTRRLSVSAALAAMAAMAVVSTTAGMGF